MSSSKKTKMLRFLHVTDCHLSESATFNAIDMKSNLSGISQPKRHAMLQDTLSKLAQDLKKDNYTLDAVLFSGDGTLQGDPKGQVLLRDMLLSELSEVGITEVSQIVATPGNHDIVSKSPPSSSERYKLFQDAWMNSSSARIPFLDGIHNIGKLNFSDHVLKGPEGEWAVFPINSANWSETTLSDENKDIAQLKDFLKSNKKGMKHLNTLEKLCTYDAARISSEQIKALEKMVKDVGDVRLRIAMLHHHLLPVSNREEIKAFADITNLGLFRQVLRDQGFHMVLHGHKHVTSAYYDHIYPDNLGSGAAHPILVVSGGTFGLNGQPSDSPLRLIEIEDIQHAPICKIRSISSYSSRQNQHIESESSNYRLWEYDATTNGPSIIYGTSIDDVYSRVIQTVRQYPDRTIICTVDFPPEERMPVPLKYPYEKNYAEKREWFEETVRWWQIPASKIEARIPYLHGSRLQRFGGGLDQIARVVSLLKEKKATSKAIAFVIDPGRDFNGKPFASFCFVQFCLRSDKRLDCIGYYRVQEFHHWWPINVAELRHLQLYVAEKVSATAGSITTITPYPRLSEDNPHPAKVAVPLIDQWVDNYPIRIAKIALTISNGTYDRADEGYLYWIRCLDDLEQAAKCFHEDGVQVSLEGLELLKDWLKASSDSNDEIIQVLENIRSTNEAHQNKLHDDVDFNRWQKTVNKNLQRLRDITKELSS